MTISQVAPNRAMYLSPIENLPLAQLGLILGQLVNITGTEGIVNDADTAVILRNIRSLACTSKTLYNAVNDPLVVEISLKFLVDKQQDSPEYFASGKATVFL